MLASSAARETQAPWELSASTGGVSGSGGVAVLWHRPKSRCQDPGDVALIHSLSMKRGVWALWVCRGTEAQLITSDLCRREKMKAEEKLLDRTNNYSSWKNKSIKNNSVYMKLFVFV